MDGDNAPQGTDSQIKPVVTDGDKPAATPQHNGGEPATQQDQKQPPVQLTPEQIAERDRKNEELRTTTSRLDRLENFAVDQMLRKDAGDFLTLNSDKYPDVKAEDLLTADDPKEFEALAKQTQARIDESVQRRLKDIEKTKQPTLTPEQKSEQEKALKKQPGIKSLEAHIAMQGKS